MLTSQEILDSYKKSARAAGLSLDVEETHKNTFEMTAGDVTLDVSFSTGQMSSVARVDGHILDDGIFYLDPVSDGIGLDRDVEVFFWHLHEVETEMRRRACKMGVFGKEGLVTDFILETVVGDIGRCALGDEEGNFRGQTRSEIKLVKRAREFFVANYDRVEALAVLKSAKALRKPSQGFLYMHRRADAALSAKKVVRIRDYEWDYKMTQEASDYIDQKFAEMRGESVESEEEAVAKPGVAA